MDESGLDTRIATIDDLETLTETITLAFAADPVWGPAMAPSVDGPDHRADIWRGQLEAALRFPWTWLAHEGGAVSVWIPPGGTEMSPEQEDPWLRRVIGLLGTAADDYVDTLGRFEEAHPHHEPHYYLSLLATHPDHRGKGLGMALLADNLARIDAEGMPAYLESTNPANDRRYRSVGFEPIGSFVTRYERAVVTTMWRTARPKG
jgi:GNAT superfamily N-acetyltransferase